MLVKPATPAPARTAGPGQSSARAPLTDQSQFALKLEELTAEPASAYTPPLIVSTHADEGRGKSRLLGTMPGDIGVIFTERKSRDTVLATAREYGRRVIGPHIDLVRTGNPMQIALLPDACITLDTLRGTPECSGNVKDEDIVKYAERKMDEVSKRIPLDGAQPMCCARHYYRWFVNRVKSVAFRMAEMPNIRSIGIDTFGQLCDDFLFACYGRNDRIIPLERRSYNQEVRDFLNAIACKNLLLTHHTATIWENNKPTGKTKPMNAFSKLGHYTSVAVKQDRQEVGTGLRYTLSVLDCPANTALIGKRELLVNEDVDFFHLAMEVYPRADPETFA